MNRTHLATLLAATAAGALAGFVGSALSTQRAVEADAAVPATDGRIDELLRSQAELARALAELRDAQALLAARPDRASVAVPAALGAAEAQPATEAPVDVAAASAAAADAPTVESLLARLLDPETPYAESQQLWDKAHKAGLLEALVAAMEDRAEREPNDPDLKVVLGNAYLQKLSTVGDMAKGKWAIKADKAFSAALELEPRHWEARFTRAVSLTHWPAVFGKQTEAIAEFQTLLGQQSTSAKEPHHALTYFYLGNMYLASGSKDKALETWQQGAALFPDNPELAQQLANAQ